MARKKTPLTIRQVISLKNELETYYAQWKAQMLADDIYYTGRYVVFTNTEPPDAFEQVRPPSAAQIVDMAADHSTGNFPRLHVPRRNESAKSQTQTTIMEKSGMGFWYRCLANSPTNILRAWAQSGALRGAIGGSLLYDADAMPDKPLPSKLGGIDSQAYKDASDEYDAQMKDAWPFKLDYIDPQHMLPDPATEGKEYIIVAFRRKVFDVKRAWPNWNGILPGGSEPARDTDEVEFISYDDDTYRCYIVAQFGGTDGVALSGGNDQGMVKHGYGFLPKFFAPAGYGSPFGRPEHRYAGIFTKAVDLLSLEARRMTHLDAVIGQTAFPWIVMQQSVVADMNLMGITRVPQGVKVQDAIAELRPSIPIQELVMELGSVRAAIQRATLPDALSSEESKSSESGYLRSLKIGTGRSRIRSLTNALEMAVQWGTSGFYKLVENKVKGPVSTWGKGMGSSDEFVTIRPADINGHYEVYATIEPSLPQDESTDIANGLKLFQAGAIPVRSLLEDYAGRENPEELLRERMGEDVLKSPMAMQQMVADALKVTQVTGGPIAEPGVRTSGQLGEGGAGLGGFGAPGPEPTLNPQSNAGVGAPKSIPTPPPGPGSLAQANTIIGRQGNVGRPNTAPAPLGGIPRRSG